MLQRLAARYAVVAIISGRSAHQLLEWLGPEVEIWGVHGAETVRNEAVALAARAEPHRELMRRVYEEARAKVEALPFEGMIVEDKGIMVGLHFRNASDVEGARVALDEIAAELVARFGLKRAGGRLAFELRPPEHFGKELVVIERALEAKLTSAMFIGDDRVDLPGFDALDQLSVDESFVAVRVAVSSAEAPAELLDRADIVLEGPGRVVEFLERLLS